MSNKQYYGKRSSIMVPVPQGVKNWAKKAFDNEKDRF